ncbi:hypothetical protein LXL04_008096 [Taraxacum kok-saghyz]
MLRITKQEDGKWLVDSFKDTHNHDVIRTPTKVMKHRSYSKFHRSIECKSLMVELNQTGLSPCQVKKAVNAMKPSNEPAVTSKQCVDVLSKQRKEHRGREFYGLIKHFQDKALLDNDQYFLVDICSDGYPRNMFWADGRSKDAYTKFGDVVVFDVTYMTNKFKFPNHYILPRWTLNFRYKVGNRSIGLREMNNENGVSAFTIWCVRSNFAKLIE